MDTPDHFTLRVGNNPQFCWRILWLPKDWEVGLVHARYSLDDLAGTITSVLQRYDHSEELRLEETILTRITTCGCNEFELNFELWNYTLYLIKMASSITSSSSFTYQFVNEPGDGFKCLICLEVAKEPWQHSKCGRLFCKACLELYGKDKPCPLCMTKQTQYFEDTKSKSTPAI